VSVEEGIAGAGPGATAERRAQGARAIVATALVWLGGSAVVALAQHGSDRKIAAVAAAGAGLATILALSRLTEDRGRAYLRSVVGATVAVSLVSDWVLWHLGAAPTGFQVDGLSKRIALPLLLVLLAPLAARALWAQRAALRRSVHGMDWIVVAYATVVLLPALAVGLAHHNRLLYVAQDLGLIVFFVGMYLVGRAVSPAAAQASAGEIVEVLLLLAAAAVLVFHFEIFPLYSFGEAASACALASLLLRPRSARLLPVGLAVTLLVLDAVQIKNGTGTSTAVELAGALGVLAYLALRTRRLVPEWLLVTLALVAIAGFIGLTRDGFALRGQYHGTDASNLGTTYEAHRVRAAVTSSPLSFAFGRGLGGTVDETHAPPAFAATLVYGGRDLAHVQEVHLLPYAFLLKAGVLGILWLAAFLGGLVILVFRALERSARERNPSLVLYAALPLLGVGQAFAASSRVQANPLNGLALGILVTSLGARPASVALIRTHRKQILAAAALTLSSCAVIGYLSTQRTFATPPPAAAPQPEALWIGDAYTAGAGATSSATGEALATSAALGWKTDMDAEGATGFVARGRKQSATNKPVPARIATDAAAYPNADVVVIDAGRNDIGYPQDKIHRAVVSTFKAVAKDFRYQAIVVIAPFVMGAKLDRARNDYLGIRRLLRRQTRKYGWAFVDPIGEGWVNRTSARLSTDGGIFPTQRGYDYIVAHLVPAITKALEAAHEQVGITCTKAAPCRGRGSTTR
jgi:hypothetical protein